MSPPTRGLPKSVRLIMLGLHFIPSKFAGSDRPFAAPFDFRQSMKSPARYVRKVRQQQLDMRACRRHVAAGTNATSWRHHASCYEDWKRQGCPTLRPASTGDGLERRATPSPGGSSFRQSILEEILTPLREDTENSATADEFGMNSE
jgi:hypothetical protein